MKVKFSRVVFVEGSWRVVALTDIGVGDITSLFLPVLTRGDGSKYVHAPEKCIFNVQDVGEKSAIRMKKATAAVHLEIYERPDYLPFIIAPGPGIFNVRSHGFRREEADPTLARAKWATLRGAHERFVLLSEIAELQGKE